MNPSSDIKSWLNNYNPDQFDIREYICSVTLYDLVISILDTDIDSQSIYIATH